MNIDRLQETDLVELARLYEEFWGAKSSIEKMTEAFHRIVGDERYQLLVVRDGGKIIGSLLGVFCDNLYGNCNPFLVIEDVIVAKEHRRKGVGKSLMKKIEEIAIKKNCESMIFVTEKNRSDAVGFYSSLGFEPGKYKGFKKHVR